MRKGEIRSAIWFQVMAPRDSTTAKEHPEIRVLFLVNH